MSKRTYSKPKVRVKVPKSFLPSQQIQDALDSVDPKRIERTCQSFSSGRLLKEIWYRENEIQIGHHDPQLLIWECEQIQEQYKKMYGK